MQNWNSPKSFLRFLNWQFTRIIQGGLGRGSKQQHKPNLVQLSDIIRWLIGENKSKKAGFDLSYFLLDLCTPIYFCQLSPHKLQFCDPPFPPINFCQSFSLKCCHYGPFVYSAVLYRRTPQGSKLWIRSLCRWHKITCFDGQAWQKLFWKVFLSLSRWSRFDLHRRVTRVIASVSREWAGSCQSVTAPPLWQASP